MSDVWHRLRFTRDHRWAPGHMSEYLDDELPSRARTRMEHHLAECPECRGVLVSLGRLLGLLQALPQRSDAPDVAAAVRGRLSEPSGR
jgi:anti-sigma factor RsiW